MRGTRPGPPGGWRRRRVRGKGTRSGPVAGVAPPCAAGAADPAVPDALGPDLLQPHHGTALGRVPDLVVTGVDADVVDVRAVVEEHQVAGSAAAGGDVVRLVVLLRGGARQLLAGLLERIERQPRAVEPSRPGGPPLVRGALLGRRDVQGLRRHRRGRGIGGEARNRDRAAHGGQGEGRGRTGTGHQRRDTIERSHAQPFVSRL